MRRVLLAVLVIAACDSATRLTSPDVSFLVVSGDGQFGTVGQPLASPLVVKATDSRGRPQRNLEVSFVVTSGGGAATPASARTDRDGLAQTSWTLGTSVSQAQRLEARATSTNALLGAFSATPLPGPPAQLAIHAGDGQSAPHDTPVAIAPGVLVSDQYGNPVPSASVTFAVTAGGGSVTGAAATSDATGVATVGSWTLGPTLGTNELTATVSGVPSVIFTASAGTGPVSADRSALSIAPATITASDGSSRTTVTVVAKDGSGFAISGATVVIAATEAGNTITQPAGATDANGTTSGTLSSTAAGQKTVSASIDGTVIVQTATATVTAGAASSILLHAGDGQTGYANDWVPIPPAARVQDAFGNPVLGVAVRFAPTAGGGYFDRPQPIYTNAAGIASIGWHLGVYPGPNSLRATAEGVDGGVDFNATGVTPAASIEIALGDQQVASAGTAVALRPTVRVRNSAGDPVGGVLVELSVTGGGGSISGAAQKSTFPDGTTYPDGWTLGPAPGLNTLLVRVAGSDIAVTFTAQGDPGFWTRLPDLPTRRFVLGTAGLNGLVYAVGGLDFGYLDAVEAYDPVAGSWTARAPLPFPRSQLGVAAVNGTLYAIGGVAGDGVGDTTIATVDAYDPVSDAWTPRAPLPGGRADFGVAVVNGIIYVIGGGGCVPRPPGTPCTWAPLATVEAYDPATDTWTPRSPMPTPRHFVAAGVVNGMIYVVGGSNATDLWLATVEAYDPATDTWTTKAPLATPRFGLAAGVIDGTLYASGGGVPPANPVLPTATVEAYDPASDTWRAKPPMLFAREHFAAAVVNGLLYAVGGNGTYSEVEVFRPQ